MTYRSQKQRRPHFEEDLDGMHGEAVYSEQIRVHSALIEFDLMIAALLFDHAQRKLAELAEFGTLKGEYTLTVRLTKSHSSGGRLQ